MGSPAASRSPLGPMNGCGTATSSSGGDRSWSGVWARWSPTCCSEGTNDRPIACDQRNDTLAGPLNKQRRSRCSSCDGLVVQHHSAPGEGLGVHEVQDNIGGDVLEQA